MKQCYVGLASLFALAACASHPGLDPNGAVVTSLSALPPPTLTDAYINSPAYTVGPFDELTIKVFNVPEISGDVTADARGVISVPLAGAIDGAGKTPTELSTILRDRLRQYIKDPQVTVNIKTTKSRTITVDGQVKEPGIYSANTALSLMRAIATAKGTSVDANEKDVVVFRTVDGKQMAALYNLGAIRRGTYADPALYPNDIIVVGDSPTQRMMRDFSPLITTPIILLLQAL